MAKRSEIKRARADSLRPDALCDYGPSGSQVEGRAGVRRLVPGVTASPSSIEAAIAVGADALLLHEGLFWRGHDGRPAGWPRERVARLLAHLAARSCIEPRFIEIHNPA